MSWSERLEQATILLDTLLEAYPEYKDHPEIQAHQAFMATQFVKPQSDQSRLLQQNSEARELNSRWSFPSNFYQLPKSSYNNDSIEHMYIKHTDTNNCMHTHRYQNNLNMHSSDKCRDNMNTFTHPKYTLINKYHPNISVNREGSGSESSPPSLSDQDIAPTTLSGGRLDHEDGMREKGEMKPGDPFVLGPSPGDMTPISPIQSSGSRNRSESNNNTKEDRLEGDLTLRGKCLAHSSADAPMSQGASAVEGTTRLPQRVNKSEDWSASPKTTCAPELHE